MDNPIQLSWGSIDPQLEICQRWLANAEGQRCWLAHFPMKKWAYLCIKLEAERVGKCMIRKVCEVDPCYAADAVAR